MTLFGVVEKPCIGIDAPEKPTISEILQFEN